MKKIAIIGASYLQMPLVMKAREMGVETHCFAWAEGAVCAAEADFFYPISVLDQEAILSTCREIGIDGITTIATDIAVPAICYTAAALALIGNSYESALDATQKDRMRACFASAGVQSPKSIAIQQGQEPELTKFNYPLIVKPVDRSGSRGVTKVERPGALTEAIEQAMSESFVRRCMVEEFIEGVEVSVESISWEGKHHILTITDKVTTGAPHFVELAHHQVSDLPERLLERIKAETLKALDALAIKYGAGHSEFRITAGGEIYIMEVGARMGGDFIGSHLVQLSTGYDFLMGVIQVALNQFEEPRLETGRSHAGVYFLSLETEKLQPYFLQQNDFDVEKQIQDAQLKSVRNSNDRSGYLIYCADQRINLL